MALPQGTLQKNEVSPGDTYKAAVARRERELGKLDSAYASWIQSKQTGGNPRGAKPKS